MLLVSLDRYSIMSEATWIVEPTDAPELALADGVARLGRLSGQTSVNAGLSEDTIDSMYYAAA